MSAVSVKGKDLPQRKRALSKHRLIVLAVAPSLAFLCFLGFAFQKLRCPQTLEAAAPAFAGEASENASPASDPQKNSHLPVKILLDAPFLDQRPDFPTGCESVTAVMALQYYGVETDPEEFISSYLPLGNAPYRDENGTLLGCDPRKAFPGDPRSEKGWGCYAGVIQKALEKAAGPGFTVKELSGVSLSSLCETYLEEGVPVLLWITIDMEKPVKGATWLLEDSDESFTWIEPMHCALLVGYDEKNYYFNDPLSGKSVPYSKKSVETAYRGLGYQAVVLKPDKLS